MMYLPGHKLTNKYYFARFVFNLMLLVIVMCSENVFAFELNYGVSQSYESTSNPLHIPDVLDDGSFEDTIMISSLFVKVREESTTLNSAVDFNINYLDYVDNVISDQTINNLNSTFLWFITPGYYSWYLMDNIVQSQRDTSRFVSDANSQDVNEFLTGPRLEWKIGGSNLKLDAYINTFTYSETDNDSTNLITTLLWSKEMPSGVKLDLKYSTKFVSFDQDDQLNPYDQSTIGASVKYIRKTDSVDVFYGRTFLNSEDVADSAFQNEKITLERNLTRYSSLTLVYSKGLSNRDESLSSGDTVLSGIFINKETVLSYQRSSSVFGLTLKAKQSEKNNLDSGYNDYSRSSEIGLFRVLSANSKLDFSYSETFNSAETALSDFEDSIYMNRLTYQKRFNNQLSFSLYVSNLSVESNNVFRQISDKKIGLTIAIVR